MKTCMRYLAVVFAVVMLVCACVSVSAAFDDVDSSNKYATAIVQMTNLGIIDGYGDNTFKPDGLVRRDEMAKIIYVTFTASKDAGDGVVLFPDVPANSWAKGHISWCAGKSIVGGYEDGTFRPEGNITFNEALKMVCSMLGYTDFNSDMWPADVQYKGLIELELGENLEDIKGDDQLTRAQVVQLVYNAFDKPLNVTTLQDKEEVENPDNPLGIIVPSTTPIVATLKNTVWKINDIQAQVIATENFRLVDFENDINADFNNPDYAKTGNPGSVVVCIREEGEPNEYMIVDLDEVGLLAYEGKTDELLGLNINMIQDRTTGDYTAATLAGTRKSNIMGAKADLTGRSDVYVYDKSWNNKATKFGVKLDGINHYDEDFTNLRRLTYYEDFALVSDGLYNYNYQDTTSSESNGQPQGLGSFVYSIASAKTTGFDRWKENIAYSMTTNFKKYTEGVDIDGDGYYDYLVIEYEELFRVKSANSRYVELEYLYESSKHWEPVNAYTCHLTGETIPALDLSFPAKNVETVTALEKDAIILGYQKGDTFVVTSITSQKTGYATMYVTNSSITLNDGTKLTSNYANDTCWISDDSDYGNGLCGKNFTDLMSNMGTVVGLVNGDYNYGKYWFIDNKLVWSESTTAAQIEIESKSYNKAVLLYVTEATEPQVNEETKVNEVMYPAYLVINGRTQLVNLNPEKAINDVQGSTVAQDGSPYRPYSLTETDGTKRIMSRNILVTYTVDSSGYYSLYTNKGNLQDATNVYEAVLDPAILAGGNFTLSIDAASGVVEIGAKDASGVTIDSSHADYATLQSYLAPYDGKIIIDETTILYYPYKSVDTGEHRHIDFYLGDEVPDNFATTDVASKIYLVKNTKTGIYTLSTLLILTDDGLNDTVNKNDYQNDARNHLYAMESVEALLKGSTTYAAYYFMELDTLQEINDDSKVKYSADLGTTEGNVYAWDSRSGLYVQVTSALPSFHDNQIISQIEEKESIFFTQGGDFATGMKINSSTNIIARMLQKNGTYEVKTVTLSEVLEQYKDMLIYNQNNPVSEPDHVLNAMIGTYEEDDIMKTAYIIIDWYDYEEE